MKKLIIFLVALLLIGCNKDDNSSPTEEQIANGGTVKTSQLVAINNTEATQEQYQATFGSRTILVAKTSENELVFKVPNQMELGEQVLTIPNLNNLKIKYQIVENVLTGTADENLSTYFSNINSYLASIEGSTNYNQVNGFFDRLDEAYQNLSEDEKIVMAKFYKANQNRFDNILTTDFSNRPAFEGSDLELLLRFSTAVIGFGASTAIAVLDPEPVTKVIATGVAIIAWSKALDYKQDFADREVKKLNVLIDGLESVLQGPNALLDFTSGSPSSLPLEYNARAIINSDSEVSNENISSYFAKHSAYNSIVQSLNGVINFINENIFLADFDLIQLSTINDTNPTITTSANDEFFNRIDFSVESSNVDLNNVSFSNGNLNITLSIIDESIVYDFLETNLVFSYQDDFNNLQGSYPIRLFKNANLFIDPRDGQEYDIVTIGNQTWFAENLNFVTGNSSCYDNDSSNCDIYGRLYDWETALTACPDGWHLPSEAELMELIDYLGGEEVAGGKMKATTGWNTPNTGATNSSGFTALPSGYRDYTGSNGFYFIGNYGYIWTSTQDVWQVKAFILHYDNTSVTSNLFDPTDSQPCRCLKD